LSERNLIVRRQKKGRDQWRINRMLQNSYGAFLAAIGKVIVSGRDEVKG